MGYYRKVLAEITGGTVTIGDVDINDASKGVQTNDLKITLDGETVTEANSNAIKTALEILDNIVNGNEAQVDVITMPTVTETNSSDILTALQLLDNIVSGNEAQVDVITMPNVTEVNSSDILTALQILDNIVSGNEAQVDVITMPTVTETNSSAIKTALQIMDDWDDSNNCKVIQQSKVLSDAHVQLTADGNIIGATAGQKIRVYKIFIYNHCTSNMSVELRNGAGGSVFCHPYLSMTGGLTEIDLFPAYWECSTNTAFYGDLGFAVSPRMDCTAVYEKV